MIEREVTGKEKEELEKLFDNSQPTHIMINGVWYYREDKLFEHLKNYIFNIFTKKENK